MVFTSGSRKALFFILLLVFCYVAYTYMIEPANENLALERAKVKEKLTKLQEIEKATAAADDLSKRLMRVEEAIKIFESKLPPKSQIHKVLESVTLIAQKHGLTPKTIRALKCKDNNGYIEQPLKMELHGDFNSYYSFLLELEKMDRITKIRQLTLSKDPKREGRTQARFEMSIFFQDANV